MPKTAQHPILDLPDFANPSRPKQYSPRAIRPAALVLEQGGLDVTVRL
jgi:hypothetical protein